MPPRIIGLLFQIGAALSFAMSAWTLLSAWLTYLGMISWNTKMSVDIGDCLAPFAFWVLGAELKRGSRIAERATIAAMIYVIVAVFLGSGYFVATGLAEHLPTSWKAAAMGLILAALSFATLSLYGLLRRRNG